MNKVESQNLVKENKSSGLIKFIWMTVISISVFGLVYYVKGSYEKFKITPEILVNQRYVHRHQVPFPALTICSPLVIKSQFLNISKLMYEVAQNKTPSVDDAAILAASGQVCERYYYDVQDIQDTKNFNEDVVKILNKVSPQMNETFVSCFTSADESCAKLLIGSLNVRGFCFTFNMLDHQSVFNEEISSDFDVYKTKTDSGNSEASTTKWTLEDGYLTDEKFVKPLRSTEAEYFQVKTIINKSEIPNLCYSRQNSYLLIIHLPNEVPTHVHDYTSFELKKNKHFRISASVKRLDESVRNFPLEMRNCYFQGERQLRFFKSYTMINCEQECVANFTLYKCGCVYFPAPRSNDMRVCKFEDIPCFAQIYNKWPSFYYEEPDNKANFPEFPCNCMPTCTEIKYNLINEHSFERKDFEGTEVLNAQINVEFTFNQILETTNYVTYQLEDLVSDVGGLAGLFLGFSILSLFELFLKAAEYIMKKIGSWTQTTKDIRQSYDGNEDHYDSDNTNEISAEPIKLYRNNRGFEEVPYPINYAKKSRRYVDNFILPRRHIHNLKIEDLEKF